MLERIERRIGDLSRAERQVARWILDHPRRVVEASLAEVARAAGTSEPSVVRFCRRLGLSGFRELKIRLAESLSRPASYAPHRDVLRGDSVTEAVSKVIDSAIQALVELRGGTAAMPLAEAVERLARARQIVFLGLGASGHVARDAHQKFFRLGVPCTLATDGPTMLQQAAIARPEDVIVAISHSGRRSETSRAAALAGDRGATVIAVTSPDSPLAAQSEIVFECHAAEDTSLYTPMGSRLAQLALLDALQVALALRLGDGAADNLQLSKDALASAYTTPLPTA